MEVPENGLAHSAQYGCDPMPIARCFAWNVFCSPVLISNTTTSYLAFELSYTTCSQRWPNQQPCSWPATHFPYSLYSRRSGNGFSWTPNRNSRCLARRKLNQENRLLG